MSVFFLLCRVLFDLESNNTECTASVCVSLTASLDVSLVFFLSFSLSLSLCLSLSLSLSFFLSFFLSLPPSLSPQAHTDYVVSLDVIPVLVHVLEVHNTEVECMREHALCALGNIARCGLQFREAVFEAGAFPHVIECCKCSKNTPLVDIATWALSCLCGVDPPPPLERTSPRHARYCRVA